MALWDAHARASGTSLVAALGGARAEVPAYGSGGFTTLDGAALADQLTSWVEQQGVHAVKIKVAEARGTREQHDLARTETARAAVGPDVDLFVDANGGYTRSQAARLGRRYCDELAVRWFEEAVSSDDVAGLALLRGALDLDIAAGEYIWRSIDAQRLLAAARWTACRRTSRGAGVHRLARRRRARPRPAVQTSTHCAPQLSVARRMRHSRGPARRVVRRSRPHRAAALRRVLEPVDGCSPRTVPPPATA